MSELVSDVYPSAIPATPRWQSSRLRTASIASIEIALPDDVVTSTEVERRLGIVPGWIVTRTGITERRRADEGADLTTLAARAANAAIDAAGLTASEIDLVLFATVTADRLLPHAAPMLALEIGAERAGALDLGAACTGFLSGLSLAAAQVEAGRAERVLVVGAEFLSRITDPNDRVTAPVFGDGAGAAVITSGGRGRIGPILLHADASEADCIVVEHDERKIRMRGQDTFRNAVARLTEVTREVSEASGLGLDEVDLFVYHQANSRITRAVGERLGLDSERVVDCIARYGNTSAASLPIALHEARADGRLREGSRVLLATFAAGFLWGGGIVEWGTA